MTKAQAYGAQSATAKLTPIEIERREPGENDVHIDIKYCGVCHSDLHTARNEWHNTVYPCVPGHEIVGVVTKVGSGVTKYKEGDKVGVGCMVDSCKSCDACKKNEEQYCGNGAVMTYNTVKDGALPTYGGYSTSITVNQEFVLRIPENLPFERTAPLLCAGITTFSPLNRYNVTKGTRVGIVGLGGLGHMAVKIAKAMGAEVTVLSHSPHKEQKAKDIGADKFVVTSSEEAMKEVTGKLDLILDTVSAKHSYDMYLALLRFEGVMVLLGAPPPSEVGAFSFLFGRKILTGSLIGGIKETQQMLDFCSKHNIASDIQMIPMEKINDAYETLTKGDFPERFVIDMASLKK